MASSSCPIRCCRRGLSSRRDAYRHVGEKGPPWGPLFVCERRDRGLAEPLVTPVRVSRAVTCLERYRRRELGRPLEDQRPSAVATSPELEPSIPGCRHPADLLLIFRVPAVIDEVARAAVLVARNVRVVSGEPTLRLSHEHRAVHFADMIGPLFLGLRRGLEARDASL
jgi:hypothetical protein